MSEGTTPSVSIPALATSLRAAITEQALTLNSSTLVDTTLAAYLLGLFGADALTLSAAQVTDITNGITVTGRASILTLADLDVTLTVTAQDGGLDLSLEALPSTAGATQFPGFSFVSVAQLKVTAHVTLTASTRSLSGAITGNISLGDVAVPISISLPAASDGLRITGSIQSGGPSPLALAGMIPGFDLVPSLPDGLSSLLAVRNFEVVLGSKPYLACTLASTQALAIVPDVLSLDSAELFLSVLLATNNNPRQIALRCKAVLRVGDNVIPITLSKDDAAGEWVMRMTGADVRLPGLAALAQLFGGAEQLTAEMPELGNFGELALTDLQLRVNVARRVISSLSFSATAQNDWTLPLFGAVSFGKPTLAISVEGLGLPSSQQIQAANPLKPVPFLSFRLSSEKSWKLIDDNSLTLDHVGLSIGVLLATANSPRSVSTRVEAWLQLGDTALPIALFNDVSTGEWVLSLDSSVIQLPSLGNLAQFLGIGNELATMVPGLDNFGALTLSGLSLRFKPTQHRLTAFSFAIAATNAWALPLFDDMALNNASVALQITNQPDVPRGVTGTISAVVQASDQTFQIAASKTSTNSDWILTGTQLEATPLSLTALVQERLGQALPSGMPEIAFTNLAVSLNAKTGAFSLSGLSTSTWSVPLGPSAVALSNVRLSLSRVIESGAKKTSMQVRGDIAIGDKTATLALAMGSGFQLSASLPAIKLSDVLGAFGGGALFEGFSLPAWMLNLTLGPSSLILDAAAKSLQLSCVDANYDTFELRLKRDSRGAMGVALAFKPKSGVDLRALLQVADLGDLQLNDVIFVLSSMHDPTLTFAAAPFANLGPITRGFGFATTIPIAGLGFGLIPNMPTAPIRMQASFGTSPSDFTLVAKMSEPGGSIIIDQASHLALIEPELRIKPAAMEFGVAGRLQVVVDTQTLEFTGGFKVSKGQAALYAGMQGDWRNPFGFQGVVARNLFLSLNLPGLPTFGGTLQIGRQSGTLFIQPSPTTPVLDLQLQNLDLQDLLSSVCDSALANVPAAYRQTLTDLRIENARIYIVPNATTINNVDYPAGIAINGKMHIFGLIVDGGVRMAGRGPLTSLLAEGSVTLPDLGELLVLAEKFDSSGVAQGSPHFKLQLQPGQLPVINIMAAAKVMKGAPSAIVVELNDAGFKFAFTGPLLGGKIKATLSISGGRLGPQAKYAVAAEVDASTLNDTLTSVGSSINAGISAATSEINRAKALVDALTAKGRALKQAEERQRQEIQAQRDADAERLRKAQADLQAQRARVDELTRSLTSARATVQAERDEVDRRVTAAQSDVDVAASAVNSLTGEINSTDSWFHGLPKVDVPWKPSQAREGTWFGIKMGGLYAARDIANGVLSVANQALQTIKDVQRTFSVDLDPRVAGILLAWNAANAGLTAAQFTVTGLLAAINLAPIDADLRVVALHTAAEMQKVQLVAAQSALDLAKNMLTGIATLGNAFVPSIMINRAYFAGELSVVNGGKVQLGLELTAGGKNRAFTIGFDLKNPADSVIEFVNQLLGVDKNKTLAAVTQSTNTAVDTVKSLDLALMTDKDVVIKSVSSGNYLTIPVDGVLRYGDTVFFQNKDTQTLLTGQVADDTSLPENTITPQRLWQLQKPNDPNSTDVIYFGDTVLLRQFGRSLIADPINGYATMGSIFVGSGTPPYQAERWILKLADNPDARSLASGAVRVALYSEYSNYLGGSTKSDHTTYPLVSTIASGKGAWDMYLQLPTGNRWPISASATPSASGTPVNTYHTRFKMVRDGDWIGFGSYVSGKYLQVMPDGSLAAYATNFIGNPAAQFQAKGATLLNQAGHYLTQAPASSIVPWVTCNATTIADGIAVEIIEIPPMPPSSYSYLIGSGGVTSSSGNATPPPPTPINVTPSSLSGGDAQAATGQKDANTGSATAGSAASAATTAAAQTRQLNASVDSKVAPATQALVQSDADRRDRRARTIEKGARAPRDGAEGWRDGALRFDGQSYLEAPATRGAIREERVDITPIIALGASFTIEAWICPESLSSEPSVILSKWRGDGEDEILFSLTETGCLRAAWRVNDATKKGTSGWYSCQSTEPVKLDAWSHVAVTRDGDAISLYIDGRRVGGALGLGTSPLRIAACNWRIGAQSGSVTNNFVGLIDSIRIWNLACSAATLRAQRFIVSRGDDDRLLACWNLDEVGGDTAFDASKFALHARLVGKVQRAVPGAPEGPPLSDRYLTLAGNAHALVGEIDLFGGSTAITIAAWVRVDRISSDLASILNKWADGNDAEVRFGIAANGKLAFAWHTQGGATLGTSGWNQINSDSAIPFSRWCHVAVVRDGKMIRFYCNGAPIGASESADTLPLRRGTTPISIGSERGQLNYFEGSLAEVRVLKRAVLAQELLENYRRPFAGDESDLTALWRCDEGTGRIVRDATSGSHHGAIVGPISWPARGGPPRLVGPTRGLRFTTSFLDFGDQDPFSPAVALTIETWINVESIDQALTSVVSKWAQSAEDEYLLGLAQDGRLIYAWRTQGTGAYGSKSYNHIYSTGKITLGRFTHIAVVRAATRVSFYIDGQDAGSSEASDNLPFRNGTTPLRIGAESTATGRYLHGTLAGLRIWRVARTAEQLCASMASLVSSREPGRILDLRFDEGEGTTVLDAVTGRAGSAQGTALPTFVSVTLPVRQLLVNTANPSDAWLQPALDVALNCKAAGVDATTAIVEVEAALALLVRPSREQVTALLAKAGYTPQALGAAFVNGVQQESSAVAQQFFQADRPAAEAIVAIDAALALAAGSSHVLALARASAAGYAPEDLGAALFDVWGHEAGTIAKMYRDAALSVTSAARAVWTVLGRYSVPCFSALAEVLLAQGTAPALVGEALRDYFGCDASSIARAVLRSGGAANVASTAAGSADVIPQAQVLAEYYIVDAKHRLCLVAGDTYDQHVYHQSPQNRQNAIWTLEAVAGGGFLIRDRKHGKCLVAGDVYDGNVYHQDPGGRLNAVWDKVSAIDSFFEDCFCLIDQKHGKAIAPSNEADNNVYHQDPAGRANARFMLVPIAKLSAHVEVQQEQSNVAQAYNFTTRPVVKSTEAGWRQQLVAFVAHAWPLPGAVPIYRETPSANPGSEFHLANRSVSDAKGAGWMQTEVAFYAFATQAPGTIPVYRERTSGRYYFTTRPSQVTTKAGFLREDIAFYAYPADAMNARPRIALKTSNGLFLNLENNGITGTNLVHKRTSLGGAEPLQIIELGQDLIALQATNNKYVSAQLNTDGKLTADRDAPAEWETFVRTVKADGTISLRAHGGKYVSPDADQVIRASSTVDLGLQSFTVVPVPAADAIPATLCNELQTVAWTKIPGGLQYVSSAKDGTVWGVSNGTIYKWNGSWQQISGVLSQISVGSATLIWGVNANDNIFRWNGTGWDSMPGLLRQVSVAEDGTVWGVNSNGATYKWNNGIWTPMPGVLRQISVGSATLIWGVNANNNVFRWNGNDWDWIPGSMKHVSVASDGTVSGVTPANVLCIWRGGSNWEVLAKNFQQVSIAAKSQVWGLSGTGEIYQGKQAARSSVNAPVLVEIQEEMSVNGSTLFKYANESKEVAAAAGWIQKGVAFVAYKDPQPGTVPIYKETPVNSPSSQWNYCHRTDQEARSGGWMQVEVAFHAFTWQAPGTIPVYRETLGLNFHLLTQSADAAPTGGQPGEIAFYAYPPSAIKQALYYIYDSKHRMCLVAGDTYDQHVYHQTPQGRLNAIFTVEPAESGGFFIRDQKHGKCLVAGDTYDQHVYHQDPGGRLNALWDKTYLGDDSYQLTDQKHGKAIVAGDTYDGNVYHQDPGGRLNARWTLIPVNALTNALLTNPGGAIYSVNAAGDLLLHHYEVSSGFDVSGWKIASGWDSMARILSAGNGHLYVITSQGALQYYHHTPNGIFDVKARALSTGWGAYIWAAVGRFGRIYSMSTNGDLLVHEHDAAFTFTTSARRIGTGWNDFLRLFAGGNGRLYAIRTNGEMLYYQHDDAWGWLRQAASMGMGWGNYASVLSAGDAMIYAVKRNGDLCLHQHDASLVFSASSGQRIARNFPAFDQFIPLPSLAAGVALIGDNWSNITSKQASVTANGLPQSPLLLATAQGGPYPDTFTLSTRTIGPSSFQVNCSRLDVLPTLTWGQSLSMGWLALAPVTRAHLQSKTFPVGAGGSQIVSASGTFTQAFATPPRVILTARGENYSDSFIVSTNGVTTNGFSARIKRADNASGWGQNLTLDCLAFDDLRDLAGIEAQSGTATVGSSNINVLTVAITFAQPFTQPPVVLLTARGNTSTEIYATTATSVTEEGFKINVTRQDGTTTWSQNLQVDWIALVPPAPGTVRPLASNLIAPIR